MNDDIIFYLTDFVTVVKNDYTGCGEYARTQSLKTWNGLVEDFFFGLQTNMISGYNYQRLTTTTTDNKNYCVKSISKEDSSGLQCAAIDLIEIMIMDVIGEWKQEQTSNSMPVVVFDAQAETVVCVIRNVYRLLMLLNENNIIYVLQITRKIKSKAILEFFLSILRVERNKDQVIAVHASMALFQAMRNDQATTEVFLDLNGIRVIITALLRGRSVFLKISLVKHIHQLLGYDDSEKMINKLNLINEVIADEIKIEGRTRDTIDLVHVLIATSAWCMRSSIFPGDDLDQRADLLEENLNVLFLLQPTYSGNLARFVKHMPSDEGKEEVLTQLGILVCDILHLCNRDSRSYRCKLATTMLLMEMPLDYSQFLYINGGVHRLFEILDMQLSEVVVEKRANDSGSVIPILVVLNKLIESNCEIKDLAKKNIFPNQLSDCEYTTSNKKSINMNQSMRPDNVPYGSLRWKMIQLMTSSDSNVKRIASELLWNVCSDAGEFVKRTGYGNAIHMLGIKGLVQLPNQSSR